MPVKWPFAEEIIRLGGVGAYKIAPDDGARQQETARSILCDLALQPGVILADEVGMGKTYVALAVIASVVLATQRSGRPIVVMMPPALKSKWPREWVQFKALCCATPESLAWIRDEYAHTPTDFFKILDYPPARRPHIVWMTNSCFWRGLDDPWVKLAFIRLARAKTKLSDSMKGRLFKWATSLVRMKSKSILETDVEWLLSHPLAKWHAYLTRVGILGQDSDDPIPTDLVRNGTRLDFGDQGEPRPGLATLLRDGTIPGKTGAVSSATEINARRRVNRALQDAYWQWIKSSTWHSPLLVMDEAHHVKNDDTTLASLFRSKETRQLVAVGDGDSSNEQPLLWEKFDRMLFLTATPFQLGHHELIRVLRSFAAAKWTGLMAPTRTRREFQAAMEELERRLNENQLAGRRLDRLWGKLAREAVARRFPDRDPVEAGAKWWRMARTGASNDAVDRALVDAIEQCRKTKARAEGDGRQPWCSLFPWVIRHNRPTQIPMDSEHPAVPRRKLCLGRAIADDDGENFAERSAIIGLPISGQEELPFLLAARAQGELAGGSRGRAFFAEGLCSSYEAFHHTREKHGDIRDVNDEGVERPSEAVTPRDQALVPIEWYEEQVERLVPSKADSEEKRYGHPKIQPVVRRAVNLWLSGEKVLIFCFYRETAKALRLHIRREVETAILGLAAQKLGFDPKKDAKGLSRWFDRVTRRLADKDSPFHRAIADVVREPLQTEVFSILRPREDELVQLLSAYVRSPSFIARYLPLDVAEVREALSEGSARQQVVRKGAAALRRAFAERTDASAMSLLGRVEEFLRFAKELAEQGRMHTAAEDGEATGPLAEYLDAIAVAAHGDVDDEEVATEVRSFRVQQPVRMVYGDTKGKTRERLMLAFNSPMFPEILISSAVLAEGVDLHRFCRYVIHHDLCWNPSTLEQRTGRLDRIRCKAEVARRPLVIYEPFLAGSADEKMFRVVQDRERWFQIVMGQKFEFDEATSEALADRVRLPHQLAKDLVFDLRRVKTIS